MKNEKAELTTDTEESFKMHMSRLLNKKNITEYLLWKHKLTKRIQKVWKRLRISPNFTPKEGAGPQKRFCTPLKNDNYGI